MDMHDMSAYRFLVATFVSIIAGLYFSDPSCRRIANQVAAFYLNC